MIRPARFVLALLPPIVALLVHLALGSYYAPHIWFLFYPAVFLSSWIGGLGAGLIASAISAIAVLTFVPVYGPTTARGQYIAASVFFLTGTLFGVLHDRLRRAHRQITHALAESRIIRAALQRSTEKATALFESAPDGIFVAGLDGRYTEVNDAGCRLLGYPRDQLVGKTIADLIPAEDLPRLADHRDRMLAGASIVSEWRLRDTTGEEIPVEISACIVGDGRWQAFVRDIRERKRGERELRETRERLELALAGASLAAWDWNLATGHAVVSPRWAELRGYAPGELTSDLATWIGGIHPEDLPGVERALADHVEGRTAAYESQYRTRTKSGQWVWILDHGRVLERDERGAPRRMAGTERDVTESRRADEERRLAEAKASGIVSIAADAIISIDHDQRITLFNEGAEAIFGYAKHEAIGQPIELLIPERFRPQHRQHVERFAMGETAARRMGSDRSHIVGLRKSGEEFPADASISRLLIDGTRILTVAIRDVTEQQRFAREQQLLAEVGAVQNATLELAALAQLTCEVLTRAFADACVIYVVEDSGAARRLAATVRDPDRSWIAADLMRTPIDRAQADHQWTALEEGRTVVMDHLTREEVDALAHNPEHLRSLRALAPETVILAPCRARGELVGALALIASRGGRPLLPADVRLAEEVAQRTALAIANSRLYAEACRAIQLRDDVLGVVAHDLRNPLGSILMQAEFMKPPPGQEDRRRTRPAVAIERSVHRMSRLIEDLLDVSRIETGKVPLERARFDAGAVIAEAIAAQAAIAAARSLALNAVVAPDVPEVWADRHRLLQIFENLIGNAIKFTPDGGTITVEAVPDPGGVRFAVADTGRGIAVDEVPHVFDRFWQAKHGRRGGAGLGLSIVKGLVEAHGGRIWLESEPGRGTTFWFTLPATPRPRPAP